MNNKGANQSNVFQVSEDIDIKPKDKIIDSYSGGKSVDIKFIEPKKNKLFPFLLIAILVVLGILVFNVVNNTKEIEKNRPTSTSSTNATTTSTTISTSANIKDTEITNFNSYLSAIIDGESGLAGNYDKIIKYKGMYFEFTCLSLDYDAYVCNSGKGSLVLPEATIPLYEFRDEKEDFINNSDHLYFSLVNDKILIAKCFDEPGTSSFVVYGLDGKYIGGKENITTSYYHNMGFETSLVPSLSNEDSPEIVSFYQCLKGNKTKRNIGLYTAKLKQHMETSQKDLKIDKKDETIFSCYEIAKE